MMRLLMRAALLLPLSLLAAPASAADANPSCPQQWRVTEIVFTAAADHADPFDFAHARFSAHFQGPDACRFEIPGFWDGGRTWKIRFTPTAPGRWAYRTAFAGAADSGLDGREGELHVAAASGTHLLHRHGGFLRVGPSARYLTCTDGTPFFWLGDTWWACPSANVPLDVFRQMVDARVKQG